MQKLKTNHYKSQLIYTKKLTKNNISYYGFKLNYDFQFSGLTFINSENLSESLYIKR